MADEKSITVFGDVVDQSAITVAITSVCGVIMAGAATYRLWLRYKRASELDDGSDENKIARLKAEVQRLQRLLDERTATTVLLTNQLTESRRESQRELQRQMREVRGLIEKERALVQETIAQEREHVRRLEEQLFESLRGNRLESTAEE